MTKTLPVTSNIKMIEVWLVVMMFYPFLVVSFFVFLASLKRRNISKSMISCVSFLLNFGLPIAVILFTVIYWTVGLLHQTLNNDVKKYC